MEKLEKKVSIIILIVVVVASLFLTLVGFISDFMWFKEMGYVAVDDLSIKAGKGKVFGMPGANGAGKSTTIECILGTKIADSGSVSILGCDPRKDRRTLFQRL